MSELQAWVDKLSTMTKEDIRSLLVAEGITGAQVDSCVCPLANFLTAHCGGYVSVGYEMVMGSDADFRCLSVNTERESLPTPNSMTEFISYFDQGLYPELIEQ